MSPASQTLLSLGSAKPLETTVRCIPDNRYLVGCAGHSGQHYRWVYAFKVFTVQNSCLQLEGKAGFSIPKTQGLGEIKGKYCVH